MSALSFPRAAVLVVLAGISCICLPGEGIAQGPLPEAPQPNVATMPFVTRETPKASTEHAFWDRSNLALFTGNAALSAADFFVTRSNLQGGGRELNPMVRIFGRSTAGLAANFAGETAGIVAVSYFFHKTGHHRLERITSTVNLGASATAVAYGLTHD